MSKKQLKSFHPWMNRGITTQSKKQLMVFASGEPLSFSNAVLLHPGGWLEMNLLSAHKGNNAMCASMVLVVDGPTHDIV